STIGDRAWRRWLRKYAAIARERSAVRALLVRLQRAEVTIERTDRGKDQRLLGEIAGVADEIAGSEIIGTVGDHVVTRDDLQRILRREALRVGFDGYVRIEPAQRGLRARHLRGSDVRGVMHDLALQVVEGDLIIVDHAKRADTGRREIHESG